MKLSQKGDYGLRALLELARQYGQGAVQAGAIASDRDIPANYLQQILLGLRRAGLVRSERGPRGGHVLARPPEEITLLEAVEALEGTVSPAACVQQGAEAACTRLDRCVFVDVWRRVDEAVQAVLGAVTLAGLARRELENEAVPMYHI